MIYNCGDLDCLREFESDNPRVFTNVFLCPECSVKLDQTLEELKKKGVTVSFVCESETVQ